MPEDGRRYEIAGLALIAPQDIVFDEHDVVQQDIVFFRAETASHRQPRRRDTASPGYRGRGALPSTAETDRGTRMRMFLRDGVPKNWIVDLVLEKIEVHALDDRSYRSRAGDTVRSMWLPDLAVEVDHTFGTPSKPLT